MTFSKNRFACVAALSLALSMGLTFGSVQNAAAADRASDVVRAKQTALFDLLKTDSTANQKKVSALFDEMLDYNALAEASLGAEWAARTPAERAQFTDLLNQLVRKAYERNLRKTLNFKIEYLGEEGDSVVTVKTKAVSQTNSREEPIEIEFKMVPRDAGWRVSDIVTESVSLVSSYRSQFTKIIKKDGFQTLITKMKDKLAKGDVQ